VKIISFAWTTNALSQDKKTVTRRFWKDDYARRFRKGDLVAAYDRSPRFKGKQVATIRLTQDPYKEPLSLMTDAEEKAEGGLWGSAEAFVEMMGGPDKVPWVVRFEVVSLT
jgi:hypothetical protein